MLVNENFISVSSGILLTADKRINKEGEKDYCLLGNR